MNTTIATDAVAVAASAVGRSRVWPRLVLLSLCGVLAAGMLILGVRQSSMAELRADLVSGKVSDIRVSGGLAVGEFGSTTQQVRWRAGWTQYEARVQHVRRMGEAPDAGRDVGARLQARHSEIEVTRGPMSLPGSTILGWGMPGAWGLLALFIWGFAVISLMAGPEPWRATRWAWFWLLSSPIGWAAYLALSGPLSPLGVPANPSKRLTGGWAFLLSIPLAGFFTTG